MLTDNELDLLISLHVPQVMQNVSTQLQIKFFFYKCSKTALSFSWVLSTRARCMYDVIFIGSLCVEY